MYSNNSSGHFVLKQIALKLVRLFKLLNKKILNEDNNYENECRWLTVPTLWQSLTVNSQLSLCIFWILSQICVNSIEWIKMYNIEINLNILNSLS